MLRTEGVGRTARHDRRLAGYLAAVAGLVNSAGFVLIGSFTSHVTGNVGRLASELAVGNPGAGFAALLIGAFFAGAFFASMVIEAAAGARPRAYGGLLVVEAGALIAFAALEYLADSTSTRVHDGEAMLLCFAMGLQNSLVTRLSGAVVRTTHLTGVVTDLGIEGARWFRHWRVRIGQRAGVRLVTGPTEGAPQQPKTLLLLTIFGAFVAGSALGAVLASQLGLVAVAVPVVALLAGGLLALVAGDPIVVAADARR